jgi:hypothetical protein
MLMNKIILEIDNLLERYGFRRMGTTWNRVLCDFVDVIDLQLSKSRNAFAINVGVAEKSVLVKCWGSDSLEFVDEASCTIRARLGELMCGRDVWWPLTGKGGIDEIINGIDNTAIPFLEINHSVDRMIDSLEKNSSASKYPPEAVYLALLHYRKGEGDRGLNMLRTLQTKLTGGWREKVSGILNELELK